MLVYDIIPPERIKKITKEILGIKNYKTKREKILNIGVRLAIFSILSLIILNNFYPFSSLEKAVKKIFAEDLKRVDFYPQTTESQTSTIIFENFSPKENFDFKTAEFKEAKIKIYFSLENDSTTTQETGFLNKIRKFTEKFFEKENKLVLAEEDIFLIESQSSTSEVLPIEEEEKEGELLDESMEGSTKETIELPLSEESPTSEPPILKEESTSESPSVSETPTSTDFATFVETQIENETSSETTTTENIEISTTTEIATKSEEKFSLWYKLGDEVWIKLSDISKTSENLEIEGQFLKSFDDVLNLNLKIEGENLSELKIEKVFVEVSFFEIKREEFEIITLKKVLKVGERPVFEIREKEKEKEGVFEKILGSLKSPSETKIKIENSKREKFELKEEDFLAESHSPVKIEILNTENLRPGVNKIEVEFELDGQIYNLETNFLWGVLAINTSKSIYLPGETAYFQIAALREDGHTLCGANLELEILNPKSEILKLSTKDGTIQKSGECGPDNVTQKPDYFAFYQVNDVGTYKMKLKNLDRGWEIEDFFEVREKVPFDIERIGPTRIYPPAKYEMKIKIKANEDFEGEIVERVPASFEIIQDTKYEIQTPKYEIRDTNPEIKEIVWKTSLKENEEIELSYQFDAPDISPYLYLLGPLTLKNKKGIFDSQFEELRQWQIASDQSNANLILLWDGDTIPSGWTCISCTTTDPYYNLYPRGAATYGTTSGTSTHTHTLSFVSCTGPSATAEYDDSGGTASYPSATHIHNTISSQTVSSVSNEPLYRSLKFIRYSGVPSTIPAGAIAIFSTTSLPTNWSAYSLQDGYFLKGSDTVATSSSNTHTHSVSITTGGPDTTEIAKAGAETGESPTHTHSGSGTSGAADHQPPYIEVVFAKASVDTSIPPGLIGMFDGSLPAAWTSVSGAGQPFNGRFLKGNSTAYGATGGSETHTHDNLDISLPATGNTINTADTASAEVGADVGHTHTFTVSFSTENHLPPYRDTIFAQYQPISISGRVFVDEGQTTSTAGSIVSLIINGSWNASTTASTTDGSFLFLVPPPATGTPITVYLDDSLEKGVTLTKYSGSGNLENLDIYLNRIILRSDSGEAISISDLDYYDSQEDSDILYTASSSAGTLETSENSEFFVWSTTTFNGWGQGIGNLSFSDLDIRGTFNATSSQEISVSCSGNFSGASCWQNLGNFNFASSTVKFTSTSTGTIINPGSSGFYNLEFDGQGGSWQFSSSTIIYGNLRMIQGALTGTQDLTIKGGNLDCGLTCGDINFTGGTTTIEGTGNFGTSGLSFDWTFYNLVFGDGVNSATTITFGSGTSTILNVLSIAGNHTLDAGQKIWVLKNSGTPFEILGNFVSGFSTFSFEGDGTTTIPSTTFYNLKINPSLNTANFVFSGSSTTTNDFSILNGNVLAPDLLAVGGNWQNQGNFFHNNGKVIFNTKDFGKIIDSGGTTTGKTFYDVEFNGNGGWQIENDILAERDLRIILAGSFDASTSQVTIEVRGDFKNLVGGNNTQWGNSTLYLNKTSGGEIEVNPKSISDNYGILKLGHNVSVLLWNSSAQNFILEEGAGFYSRNHQGNNGLLYIEGNFEMTTGTEYWSYSKDFDGEEISGRQVTVQIASLSSFTLNGASLEISGTSTYPTIITNNGNGNFSFNLISGTFSANFYQFRNLDQNGLNVTSTVNVLSLDNGDFELAVNGGSLITVSPGIIEMGTKTFNSIRFATSTLATSGYNVKLTGSPSCSQSQCYWRFTNHYGGLDGENYDLDPGDQSPGWLQWDDSQYYTPRSQNWRFYFDFNEEKPQEPSAPENSAPIDVAKNTILKLRMSIKNIMDFPGENIKMRLQYSTSSDFSNAFFVKEIGECTGDDIFCYADGIDNDNDPITTLLLSDSQTTSTHNESGISTSTYTHQALSVAEWEFTIKAVNVQEGQVYYLRAFDNTNNQPVLPNDGYSYSSLVAGTSQLSFLIDGLPAGTSTEGITTTIDALPNAISFSTLDFDTSQIGGHRFQISTNAPSGYQLFVFQGDNLKSSGGEGISPFPCSNESPCSWNSWKNYNLPSAYGYHTGDDILSGGSSRFAPNDSYAAFETEPKEIGFHPFPVSNQIFDLIFRIEVTKLQSAGDYFTEIIYLLIPTF